MPYRNDYDPPIPVLLFLLFAVFAVLVAGCATTGSSVPIGEPERITYQAEIQNHSWDAQAVRFACDGIYAGSVRNLDIGDQVRFPLQGNRFCNAVSFSVVGIGGERIMESGPIVMTRDALLEITVESSVNLTYWRLR